MIDRFGFKIQVGWSPCELEWLRVAVMDGADGIRQVSELTGRTFSACYSKAWSLGYRGKRHRVDTMPKVAVVWVRPKPVIAEPPAIRPLTPHDLMTGGAKRRVSPEILAL